MMASDHEIFLLKFFFFIVRLLYLKTEGLLSFFRFQSKFLPTLVKIRLSTWDFIEFIQYTV